MSKAMKVSIIRAINWTVVAICMILIFANGDTIKEWGDNRTKTILLAILFLIGYGTEALTRTMEKTKKWKIKRDERDKAIEYQSLGIGFVSIMIYIFILSISLYTYFEQSGFMPIGWVWFIAYSTIVVASLSASYSSLFLYRKHGY